MILAIRTDKPLAELYLCKDDVIVDTLQWEAHRQLTDTIHIQIETLLHRNNLDWAQIVGVIVFKGPGSFTGLRIGITVANTIAYAQQIATVGAQGDAWLQDGLVRLTQKQNDIIVIPEYGGQINITSPKK
jgi:tRNA threonylcarbamoyladenosine biosynthesis protein TsaB